MRIAFASDHAAADIRDDIIREIERLGHKVEDVGYGGTESVDYPDYAAKAIAVHKQGRADLIVLMCGTGLGMAYSANRTPGIRCARCMDEFDAIMSRQHNDANCLALRSREQSPEMNKRILKTFLETPFEGGRHQRRVDKIEQVPEMVKGEGKQ